MACMISLLHALFRSAGLIPEEVEEMATLELLDCSNNELSGKNSWHDVPLVVWSAVRVRTKCLHWPLLLRRQHKRTWCINIPPIGQEAA